MKSTPNDISKGEMINNCQKKQTFVYKSNSGFELISDSGV